MSLDYRLLFIYHISMMVMMMAAQSGLSYTQEVGAALILVVVLAAVSLKHRQKNNWRWPGISGKNAFNAILTIAAITFFLLAASPTLSPPKPQILPWYLAGIGIGTFSVLNALRIVTTSNTEFLMNCHIICRSGEEIPVFSELPVPVEVQWKKVARGIFTGCFLLIWVFGVLSFYANGKAVKNGSKEPTTTHSEPLINHGRTVYITPAEKEWIDRLRSVYWLLIPVIIGGLVLHFIAGVKLFGNAPSLPEYSRHSRN